MISVVIPTYKRIVDLKKTLKAIEGQTLNPDEVIVVSGDDGLTLADISLSKVQDLKLIVTQPSVCLQRNEGLKTSQGNLVLLCDDDVELAPNYIEKLVGLAEKHDDLNIFSGLFCEHRDGKWQSQFPEKNQFTLLYKWIFGLGVWTDLQLPINNKGIIATFLRKKYHKLNNTSRKSGWPIISSFSSNPFPVRFYTLGAALVRRDWILNHLFDEVLDRSGIGENYGVCIQTEQKMGVLLVPDAIAYHNKSNSNRLDQPVSYYRRIMAMDYFNVRFAKPNYSRLYLIWSIFGNLLLHMRSLKMRLILADIKLICNLLIDQNPYAIAQRKGTKFCSP